MAGKLLKFIFCPLSDNSLDSASTALRSKAKKYLLPQPTRYTGHTENRVWFIHERTSCLNEETWPKGIPFWEKWSQSIFCCCCCCSPWNSLNGFTGVRDTAPCPAAQHPLLLLSTEKKKIRLNGPFVHCAAFRPETARKNRGTTFPYRWPEIVNGTWIMITIKRRTIRGAPFFPHSLSNVRSESFSAVCPGLEPEPGWFRQIMARHGGGQQPGWSDVNFPTKTPLSYSTL